MCAPAPNYFVPYRTIHNYSTRYFGRPQCTQLYNTQNLRSQGPKAPSVNSTKSVLLYAIMLVFQCQIKGFSANTWWNTDWWQRQLSKSNGRILLRVGINWEIHPLQTLRFPSAADFAFLGPRYWPRAWTRVISALRKSLGPRRMYFPVHPSSLQCTDTRCGPDVQY